MKDFAHLLAPLRDFYGPGDPFPRATAIAEKDLPQPYRRLLAHHRDMTGTLERFRGERMTLKVLEEARHGSRYARRVILVAADSGRTLEYGGIVIHLENFPEAVQGDIVKGNTPLGAILRAAAISYRSRPQRFIKLEAGADLIELFGPGSDAGLFGRCNQLTTPTGDPLAEIVEILPVLTEAEAADRVTSRHQRMDAIVIGGGPAGAAAATVLATSGHRVALLEKEALPRYRVGESLLPFCYHPLKKLGLIDTMKRSAFVKKFSVQFASTSGRVSSPFYFDDHMKDDEAAKTWQVERALFDQILLDNAVAQGVALHQAMAVQKLTQNDRGAITGCTAEDADGETWVFEAPLTIDATGRDSLAISQLKWRVMDSVLKKIAVWTYYKGAKRDTGRDEGATTVAYLNHKNWFWFIPLQNDTVSVGLVGDAKTLLPKGPKTEAYYDRLFKARIAENPWISERLAPAQRVRDYRATGDFSYRARHCATDGLVLTGDAFAFLDPVFSSGVLLALQSGVQVGEAADAALRDGDTRGERFREYGARFCQAIEPMRKLVYAFYDADFSFRAFFEKYPGMRQDVTDCLIGNLERDYDRLFAAVAEFADMPAPLEHGLPLTGVS